MKKPPLTHDRATDLDDVRRTFEDLAGELGSWSLRVEDSREETVRVRRGVLEPPASRLRRGAFVTVAENGGVGYGATSDLSPAGLAAALEEARRWAARSAALGLLPGVGLPLARATGRYTATVAQPWDDVPLTDKVDLLQDACRRLKRADAIVDWEASLRARRVERLLATSAGGRFAQAFPLITADLAAVASRGGDTQRRSHGGWDGVRQGGLEQLAALGFPDQAERVAEEALELLAAPECPTGTRDLLLLPGQMALQVHESIGHPLELDRILGDERNFAGSSFVRPDMFGRYRYGSELLNVTFDPTVPGEVASYAFDDEGTPATREYLIRAGVLERPLGGALSQARSGLPGVACARASGWNRPPIDRMANLNVEPGEQTFEDLIAAVEDGVLMDTNRSWSIDDTRNKFQFGCEYGRRIRRGRL
ncbi:MAG: TldD/PmbA family protein, partial [Gammaproteobacteria bacterium]|nr:TldD/PmbA family protein [Gammaproteobacteria bacterium]